MLLQASLFGGGPTSVDPAVAVERVELDPTSWIDVARGWLRGPDPFFERLVTEAPWRQGRREMYGRVVDDPRWSWAPSEEDQPAEMAEVRTALQARYGEWFSRGFCNYYRDGSDSVAFHGDRVLRDSDEPSLVAVLTLGATRSFLVRPKCGGRSIDLRPGTGDLIVMGGRCQRDHEHSVPKCRHAGPRISISFRTSAHEPPRMGQESLKRF